MESGFSFFIQLQTSTFHFPFFILRFFILPMARLFRFLSFLILSLPLLVACGDDDIVRPTPDPNTGITPLEVKGHRTVLVYMAAQNSLGTARFHRSDSAEVMAGRQYLADNDRLLLFIDDNTAPPRIYRVTKSQEKPQLVRSWAADSCSTSLAFFENVLTWMRNYYPAEEYGLVMWSHADGWLPSTNTDYSASRIHLKSFGIDDGTGREDAGAQMDVDSMATAITAAGIHPKYIFFDACLMQTVEVAYALKDVTDYVIGAPIQTYAKGANYTSLLRNGLFATDPTQIVSTYYADVTDAKQGYDDFGVVLSAVRTDKMDALASAFNRALYTSSLAGQWSPDMDGVLYYQEYCSTYLWRPHCYDARQAIERVFTNKQACADILAALDEAIVRKAATTSFYIGPGMFDMQNVDTTDYAGISLFIPQDAYTTRANAYTNRYGDHNASFRATRWYKATGWEQIGW